MNIPGRSLACRHGEYLLLMLMLSLDVHFWSDLIRKSYSSAAR